MADQDNLNINMATASTQQGDPHGSPLSDNQQPPFAPILAQNDSRFFKKLPQEIRDMIYCQVFANTRLTHGPKRDISEGPLVIIKPTPHSLALLRTCQCAQQEIGNRWLRHVLFDFQDPHTMIEKLSPLPKQLLSQIRHIRDFVEPNFFPIEPEFLEYHNVVHAIKMVPGLKLDVLTVLVNLQPSWTYYMLNKLIRNASGWKELRFLSPDSEMLGYAYHKEGIVPRWPQPGNWQRMLEFDDGIESQPSVVIYRAKEPFGGSEANTGIMSDPSQWESYEQKGPEVHSGLHYGEMEDKHIMDTPVERGKDIVVIARRGKGAHYEENHIWNSPQDADDLRGTVMDWMEERKGWMNSRCVDEKPAKEIVEAAEPPSTSVDEFEWCHFHIM